MDKQEPTGPVTSDSLAAESIRASGGFSENRNSEPLSVEGRNSTFANTDTSSARTLGPTADSEARNDDDVDDALKGPGGTKYAEALGGQGVNPGTTNGSGYYGASSADKSGRVDVDAAPSYVQNAMSGSQGQPKGKDLKEGDFSGTSANTDGFAEPGSKNDPGRAGVEQFGQRSVDDVGTGPRQANVTGDGQYDALREEDA